jgi:hypothetical protein
MSYAISSGVIGAIITSIGAFFFIMAMKQERKQAIRES